MQFSLIVPFHNVEKYIEECIRSLYNQDIPLEEYEVICVNDCSPDNSVDIVKRLQKEYPNLILIEHLENKKLGGARNTGLKYAKGEYVWFVDSDDYIMPNVLKKAYENLSNHDLDFLHFGCNECVAGKLMINNSIETTSVMNGVSLFLNDKFIWWKDHITAWCKIYKREFLIENKIQFAENIMYEDNDYAINIYAYAQKTMHISENMYVYRKNNSSITNMTYNANHIHYWLQLINRLISLKVNLKRKGFCNRFQLLIRNFIINIFRNTIINYKKLGKIERRKARLYIMCEVKLSYIQYINICKFIKCKFGII